MFSKCGARAVHGRSDKDLRPAAFDNFPSLAIWKLMPGEGVWWGRKRR